MSHLIHAIIHQIKDREFRIRFLKFSMVGISGVVVNQGLLMLLAESTRLPFYFCSLIAIECSILTNFFLNDLWTWRDKRESPLLIRLFKYNTSTAFSSIFVNMSVLLFLKEWAGIPYQFANLAGIGCAMLANFIFNHYWTYGTFKIQLPHMIWKILWISLGVRLALAAVVGAGYDEAYYYSYSLRPALSYFDHPPFVGFLAGFFPVLTGVVNAFTIRLGAILLFSVSGLLFYQFAKSILSEKAAVIAYGLFNLTPIFSLGAGVMILPDAGLTFFWICALFLIYRIVRESDALFTWGLAGLLTGLAFLSKYHGVLLGVMLILYILLFRRSLIRTLKPYLFAVISLLTALPVIVWNIRHHWISFSFQMERSAGTSLSLIKLGQAIGSQAVYLTPMIFIPLYVILFQIVKRMFKNRDLHSRFYFVFGALPVLFMLLISLQRPILPHWTLPGNILLMVPLSGWIQQKLESGRAMKVWTRFTVCFIAGFLLVAVLHVRFGILHLEKLVERGWLKERDFRKEATLDAVGWEKVPEYLNAHHFNPDSTFLFTHKWFLGGEIDLAVAGKYPVMCFNRLQDARGFGIWDRDLDMRGKDGIFICTNRYEAKPNEVWPDYFESISKPDTVIACRGGVASKAFYFYRCRKLLKRFDADGIL